MEMLKCYMLSRNSHWYRRHHGMCFLWASSSSTTSWHQGLITHLMKFRAPLDLLQASCL